MTCTNEMVRRVVFGSLALALLWGVGGCATGASPFDSARTSQPSTVRFQTFDVADAQGCGITLDGQVACWGRGPAVDTSPSASRWSAVAVNNELACGIDGEGRLRCWGEGAALSGPFETGEHRFEQVTLGRDICGLTEKGRVICQDIASGDVTKWEGQFTDLSSGAIASCALTSEASVICVRGDGRKKRFFADRDDLTAVETFGNSVCILDGGQAVRCRSLQTGERIPTPTGRYVSVDGRGRNRCALGTKGEAVCWPIGTDRGTRISGPFEQVQAGEGFVCGLVEGGYIICRGGDGSGGDAPRDTMSEDTTGQGSSTLRQRSRLTANSSRMGGDTE